MFRKTLIAGLVIACGASAAAAQSPNLRDLTIVPAVAPAQPSQAGLAAWFDRADATYALGEAVTLSVQASQDGYVSAFSIGPTGDVTEIYPNAFHPDNFIRAGQTIEVPGPGARALVTGPIGSERIQVVMTRQTGPVCAHAQVSGAGPFRSVIGGVETLQRDLSVVAANEPGGALATLEKSFQSTDAVGVADPSTMVVLANPANPPADETKVLIPSRGFPLPRR